MAFTHIFSSNLSRARLTADAILEAQANEKLSEKIKAERIVLEILREQDFGSFECQRWNSKPNGKGADGRFIGPGQPDFQPKETHESMVTRVNTFLDDMILPLLAADSKSESTVAVVSHGITLSVLWKALLQRFGARTLSLGIEVGVSTGSRSLEYLPSWSNTGYLELDIKSAATGPDLNTPHPVDSDLRTPILSGYRMLIKTVNGKDHLHGLKRTRGGLGSTPFDAKQKSLEGFFKKPKIDGKNQETG